jgi:hypothetical protein
MKKLRSNSGFTMAVFLALLLMLTLVGISSVMTSTVDVDIAGNEINYVKAFYAAEAGIEKASAELAASYKATGGHPSPLPTGTITVGGHTVTYQTTQLTGAVPRELAYGACRGLYAMATEYEVRSTSQLSGTEAQSTVVQIIESDMVPLFQFAVFYQNDVEIAPLSPMTIGGRVHTNGDLYLQSSNGLNIDSYTTAAGSIFHGRKVGSGQSLSSGDVRIKDANGNYQDMYQGGKWLDAADPDWVAQSISRWGGRVEDGQHGITRLDLPVVSSGGPEDMIATAAESPDSYEEKATLRIVDGSANYRQLDGSWIDVTASLQAEGSLAASSFYDAHQQRWVDSWDIDFSVFKNSAYFPSNGIMYTANTATGGNLKATRIKNGSDIGANFTLSSKNSVYIQGDYNTVNKHASAVMTDAFTILSNSWNDSQSSQPLSSRIATETTVNCSYVTGNQSTGEDGSAYNGGFENLPRFLEHWSGVDFNWKGSAAALWVSKEATYPWSYGNYYTAPNLNWAFDEDLTDPTKLPPGTPMIAVFQKVSWREEIAQN